MLAYTHIAFNGAMALLMGLLVGIEREHERERSRMALPVFAGIRTFPLITLFGFLCGLAALAGYG
jgi:ABC-type proline/glycine betaine transport system permease subunit